ncbi:hypothetical protein DFH07DRAFT_1060645 [Mycena maculata]|uniref:Uncharacterized protein n=1 Tax=Mycena maculata TaxID=230809 RepID=A0AAD7J4X0_9AGAR|nr:hypothetical protein DFH07DRAFT_1060645 [Mycena maculata]
MFSPINTLEPWTRPTRAAMRFPFPSRAKVKPLASTLKPRLARTKRVLPDALQTSLLALKESADAFPPLKSAVGGVIALCDIVERAKDSKSNACDIVVRTKEILDAIADAVPDATMISPPILKSIERFTLMLDDIKCRMEAITLTSGVVRIVHLNRNERALKNIKMQLDDVYRDFRAAALLRVEVQQMQLVIEQVRMQRDIEKVVYTTDNLAPDLSQVLLFSRLTFFFWPAPDLTHILPSDNIPRFARGAASQGLRWPT